MSSMLQPDTEEALEGLLHSETSELAEFISLLEVELDALAVGSAEAIQVCANRKQELLGRIFSTRDAVNAVARRAASNPHLKSAASWLSASSSIRVREAFSELTERAAQARELNQLASRLIKIKLGSVNERLDVLRPTAAMAAVYYPEGFAAAQRSCNGIIGRA